ncbi:hypothetical protein ACE2AJ_00705 [Aquihabitans daechungensis]|uniref:hypothetical protein n=1 Tax=Aquihabitans daechungensis TaxID=1052257 RepID=UPI003B9FA32C
MLVAEDRHGAVGHRPLRQSGDEVVNGARRAPRVERRAEAGGPLHERDACVAAQLRFAGCHQDDGDGGGQGLGGQPCGRDGRDATAVDQQPGTGQGRDRHRGLDRHHRVHAPVDVPDRHGDRGDGVRNRSQRQQAQDRGGVGAVGRPEQVHDPGRGRHREGDGRHEQPADQAPGVPQVVGEPAVTGGLCNQGVAHVARDDEEGVGDLERHVPGGGCLVAGVHHDDQRGQVQR